MRPLAVAAKLRTGDRSESSRSTESGIHTHPWYFYLERLIAYRPARGFFWTEGLIVGLAVVGGLASIKRYKTDSFGFFLTLYTVFITTLYALIPYKTPWCSLSFFHAMILLAGVGTMAVASGQWSVDSGQYGGACLRACLKWSSRVVRALLLLGIIAGIGHLGWECFWLNFRLPADTRNPWVYAHTSPDVLHFAAQMERLAAVAPEGYELSIHVITPENYWPLPWYLRRFDADRIGYWSSATDWARDAARLPPPTVIVVSPQMKSQIDAHLRAKYNQQITFGLRPGVLMLVLMRADLWDRFLLPQPAD